MHFIYVRVEYVILKKRKIVFILAESVFMLYCSMYKVTWCGLLCFSFFAFFEMCLS